MCHKAGFCFTFYALYIVSFLKLCLLELFYSLFYCLSYQMKESHLMCTHFASMTNNELEMTLPKTALGTKAHKFYVYGLMI